jgi:hypothetical protein
MERGMDKREELREGSERMGKWERGGMKEETCVECSKGRLEDDVLRDPRSDHIFIRFSPDQSTGNQ